MNKEIQFLTYKELLDKLKSQKENNLLLGNGFNLSLGIKTDYESIFEKMKEEFSIYKELENDKNDIEKIIDNLKDEIKNSFLKKFINNKIKLDFMKATSSIVKENIKNIYQEKNEGIHLLFKNFTNYFTLNYDPLLYLLLMNFKNKKPIQHKNNNQLAIAFENTVKYKKNDLSLDEQGIYDQLKDDHKNGNITFQDEIKVSLNVLTKSKFSNAVELHIKAKNIDIQDNKLKYLLDLLWDEIKDKGKSGELNFNDGFTDDLFDTKKEKELQYKQNKTQNLFFLHGAFSFYEKTQKMKKEIFKITSKQDKALYEKLEEIIHNEDEDIVCVFTNNNKKDEIDKNTYLKNAYEKLKALTGSIVILGSALSDNDEHIFKAINESETTNIYISCFKEEKENILKNAKEHFKNKNIILFDSGTISYYKNNDDK